MPNRATLNVSLTPELEQFVHSRIASGRYQTASEVIREGLRLLEEREQTREAALEELRSHLKRGIEQAERGEFVDGEAVFEEIRQLSTRGKLSNEAGAPLSVELQKIDYTNRFRGCENPRQPLPDGRGSV